MHIWDKSEQKNCAKKEHGRRESDRQTKAKKKKDFRQVRGGTKILKRSVGVKRS